MPTEPLATVLEHLIEMQDPCFDDTLFNASYWLDQARLYTQPAPRTEQVHIRITTLEKAELQRLAEDAGQTMSDYARARIFADT